MRRLLFISTILLPAFCLAQPGVADSISVGVVDPFSEPVFPAKKLTVNAWFKAFSTSTAVPSAFSNAFIFPAFIDQSLKENAFKRLGSRNVFGGELTSGVSFNFAPDSTWNTRNQAAGIVYNTTYIQVAAISTDLFRTVFAGNAGFAGKTADFDHSSFYGIGYQTLKFSFLQKTSRLQFRISAGVARGFSTTNVTLESGKLYTHPEGEYLDLAWKGTYYQSSNSSNQFKNSPSFGPALDLWLQVSTGKKSNLSLAIQDLGFINWNEQTSSFVSDTSFRFSGLTITNLLSFSDSTFVIGDTLLTKLRGKEIRSTFMQSLPTLFSASFNFNPSTRWFTSASVQYRLVPGYFPLSSLQLGRSFKNSMSLGITVSYGGYGSFQSGLQFVAIHSSHHFLKLGTVFNEGFLVPSKLSGNGLFFSYAYSL